MEYIILFLWLYMMWIRTIRVIIHVHRVMMSVSFHDFSFFPPSHFLLHILKFPHSSLIPHSPALIIYHSPLIRENIRPLVFWLISLSMIFSNSIHLFTNAIILFFFMAE